MERTDRGAPDAEIAREGDGEGDAFVWSSAARPKPHLWDKRPPETAMSVVTDIHDVFIDWFLADHPELLCLHAGAVEMGEGLVVFPSVGKSGKSTLAVTLAARGRRFICDDVLPRSGDRGRAGLGHRAAAQEARARDGRARGFRYGPRWSQQQELDLCEIGSQRDGAVRIAPADRGARSARTARARSTVVGAGRESRDAQGGDPAEFGAHRAAAMVLDSLARLIEATDCYRLVYGDVAEAADLLEERFA